MYRRNPAVVDQHVGSRVMLLDPEAAELITLNATGAAVWQSLDQPATLDGVVDALSTRWPGVGTTVLRTDANAFLAELTELRAVLTD